MGLKEELMCPMNLKTDQNVPVIVTLHGIGSNFFDLRPLVSIFGPSLIELHLQGAIAYGSGFTYYIPRFYKFSENQLIGNAAEKLYLQIKHDLKEHDLQDHPLAVIGFSQGAILAATLLAFHPSSFSAAILFSGRMPKFVEEWSKLNLMPGQIKTNIFISQGEKDPIFPIRSGEQLVNFFEKFGNHVSYQSYPMGHTICLKAVHDAYDWAQQLKWQNN
ncbi:alpha/beta hydrolase [Liquorilactobacillus vini]|uniref:Phospholipase carboxylesterase n=1 Tax=Liquorilactobacillus vini DSM 20605 TaxID=1133569 RepID=A0A0R2CAR7_9LACO|nr:dienelactone hydrolase family protein [Liquorilactobacillus vini]KRM88464.1 phospholipase carboxylesterase [Liquorilactobacillus vini DSM 20605]